MRFRDRREAGRRLAQALVSLSAERPVVLALPRGGVPVAMEVARALHAPLDVILVRKIGMPGHPEFGLGAIGEDGARFVDAQRAHRLGVSDVQLDQLEAAERIELDRRRDRYRGNNAPIDLHDRVAIIVDDGIATGGTVRAAIQAARARGAARVIVAAPVAAPETVVDLQRIADDIVVVTVPTRLQAVGDWYDDFRPVPEDDVVMMLRRAMPEPATVGPDSSDNHRGISREVHIPDGVVTLDGSLVVPNECLGLVVFAHGSGSSRHSPRNRAVAAALQQAGLGTLLFDLLSDHEAEARSHVFDIELLAQRLLAATGWLRRQSGLGSLPMGYFGASTGSAAALRAAAERGNNVRAVVSRGGRPDLAERWLPMVTAPTLLIVGGADTEVLALNSEAATHLRGPHQIAVVRGATHLFEEPGALEAATRLATAWFVDNLTAAPAMRSLAS